MFVAPALIAEHRLIRRLREAGALSPERAQPFPALRFVERRRLAHLLQRGAVGETTPGMYYLDPPAYEALRAARRRLALATALLMLLGLAVILFVSS